MDSSTGQTNTLLVFSKNILVNQLKIAAPTIEKSFDSLCDPDVQELSEFLSETLALLLSGHRAASNRNRELHRICAELLMNAGNSFCAALTLLRTGYVLQPGIVLRSLMESVSTMLHLVQFPKDIVAYKNDALKSPKTISSAKKLLPPFGGLYGFYSENFTHISRLHRSVEPVRAYESRDEGLELNLAFFRMSAWLLYVATELLFGELLEETRYWKFRDDVVTSWAPSAQERDWMSSFFRIPD